MAPRGERRAREAAEQLRRESNFRRRRRDLNTPRPVLEEETAEMVDTTIKKTVRKPFFVIEFALPKSND